MKFLITLTTIVTVTLSFSGPTYSQPLSIMDLYEHAELDIHKGWYPQDLDTLIRFSDIIVKGKFGARPQPWSILGIRGNASEHRSATR
ncbi:hypothetical protein GCM10011403_14220 [Pseudohongiella nitratireducens]|uniref:Uncharacterized protein n=1 Tax=Pseudohongiella nitratireducens TaxID=1768907 RepID=A0A917GVA2_9GAMM|nr:hypothetical protein GCM10011403_14220 [Pseudohongiella nitratireducens]